MTTQTTETLYTETLWGAWGADAPHGTLPAATFPLWVDARCWAVGTYGQNWEQFVSVRPVPPEQVREMAARRAAQIAYANAYNEWMAPPEPVAELAACSDQTLHILGLTLLVAGAAMAGIAVAHAGLANCCLWTLGTTGVALGLWMGNRYARHKGAEQKEK